MEKLFSFYYKICDKYFPITSKTKGTIIFILSIALPIFVPTIILASIFPTIPGQIFLVGFMMIWCFTFCSLSLHASRGMQELDFQKEDKRRKTPSHYMFYRLKNHKTGEWQEWTRMDMKDEYNSKFNKNWYEQFIKPLVATGDAEVEMGGMTEDEKKEMRRNASLEALLKEK
jgi:hypothetical protein